MAESTGSAIPDRSTLRLALTVGGLVVALVAGFGVGRGTGEPSWSGSTGSGSVGAGVPEHTHSPGTGPHEHLTAASQENTVASVSGLAVTAAGYTLAPLTSTFTAGKPGEFRFRVQGDEQRTATRFAIVHEKPLHLIVVRRDLSGYQHLHPQMAPDGTWSVPLTLAEPGVWRAYADFTVLGDDGQQTAVTLGVDLVSAGGYTPRPLPPAARDASVDGFTVEYAGTPQIGASAPLLFRVLADGKPVDGLERYLGTYGHLVALREGDLGYLHVHPEPELVDGAVKFWLAVPGPGRYRLYFDFQVAGEVHTAEFTLTVP